MARVRTFPLVVAVALGAALVGGCSSSSKSSSGSSSASSSSAAGGVTVPGGSGGTTVNVTVGDTKGTDGPMTLTASPATAPAGNVTFTVKNNGTIDHEVIVLKTDTPYDQLPVVDAGDPPAPVTTGADKVSEDTKVGETGDPNLKPGESRSFTINNMTAGKYALVCNIAKHYQMGMRAPFTVT